MFPPQRLTLPSTLRGLRWVLTGVGILWLMTDLATSDVIVFSQTYSEYEVKAAFLFKFTKFVEWPAPDEGENIEDKPPPFRIGVLGEDPFGRLLDDTVRDQQVAGRRIEIARGEALPEIGRCEVLFISTSLEQVAEQVLEAVKEEQTLTVSDMEGFLDKGGMVHLDLDGSRVMFRIDQQAAEEARLKISAQLLKLAKEVRKGGTEQSGQPQREATGTRR